MRQQDETYHWPRSIESPAIALEPQGRVWLLVGHQEDRGCRAVPVDPHMLIYSILVLHSASVACS